MERESSHDAAMMHETERGDMFEAEEESSQLPSGFIERTTTDIREVMLPPDFDPNDDKWSDGKFIEWIETVGYDEGYEEVEREWYTEMAEHEARIIRTLIDDYEHEGPVSMGGLEAIVPQAHEDEMRHEEGIDWDRVELHTQEVIDELNMMEALFPGSELRKQAEQHVEEKRNERRANPITLLMESLRALPMVRKGVMVLAMLGGLKLMPGKAKADEHAALLGAYEKAVAASRGSERTAEVETPRERRGRAEKESRAKEVSYTTREVAKRDAAFTDMEFAPKFKPMESADDVDVSSLLDKVRKWMMDHEHAKDLEAHVTLYGKASLDANPKKYNNNELLAKKRALPVKERLAREWKKLFPEVPLVVEIDEGRPLITVDGETMTHDEAREKAKKLFGTDDDVELWKMFIKYRMGKSKNLNSAQQNFLRQVIDEARGVEMDLQITGTEVSEHEVPEKPSTKAPKKETVPEDTSAPELPKQPAVSMTLAREKARKEDYDATPAPEEAPGERPRPRYEEKEVAQSRMTIIKEQLKRRIATIFRQRKRRRIDDVEPTPSHDAHASREMQPMKTERASARPRPIRALSEDRAQFDDLVDVDSGMGTYGRKGKRTGRESVKLDEDNEAEYLPVRQPTARKRTRRPPRSRQEEARKRTQMKRDGRKTKPGSL